eukprot:7042611-Prymnesium_polylepis.1
MASNGRACGYILHRHTHAQASASLLVKAWCRKDNAPCCRTCSDRRCRRRASRRSPRGRPRLRLVGCPHDRRRVAAAPHAAQL